MEPIRNIKTPAHNLVRFPILHSFAKLPYGADLQSFWGLLFSDEMQQTIINYTYIKIRKMRQ